MMFVCKTPWIDSRHTGHLLSHFGQQLEQNVWPHAVETGSIINSKQTGQEKLSSGMGGSPIFPCELQAGLRVSVGQLAES
jgi:hypothetical protein